MRFAYADPPYLGQGNRYPEHPDALDWDREETHVELVARLRAEYPDGFAISLSTPSLGLYLRELPEARIGAWVKPFAAFKRNVRIAYTWEPILFLGGRSSSSTGATPNRDHISAPITMRRGLVGAKPQIVCSWILDLLGWIPGDDVDDLFPGTGVMGRTVALRSETTAEDALALWESS